ncbi:MAG: hypothetical protein GX636_11235 [Actinomycetales bacterium]|nr:hypothetical protein [Actinomycetales bacterium]
MTNRFDVPHDVLMQMVPNIGHAVAYMFTWGNAANLVSIVQGIDAASGGPGRY